MITSRRQAQNENEPNTPTSGNEDILAQGGWETLRHSVKGRYQRIEIRRRLDRDANSQRLTPRELQIARLAACGLASKQIGTRLGLSGTSVRAILSRATRKLGLRGCNQLPAFWYGIAVRSSRVVSGPGIELLVFESVLRTEKPAAPLTAAERSVLLVVLSGFDNRQIAAKRATSARTVANQVAMLFKKFGVSSKAGLAARSLGVFDSTQAITVNDPFKPSACSRSRAEHRSTR